MGKHRESDNIHLEVTISHQLYKLQLKRMFFVVFCLELKFRSRQERQERLILRNLRDLYTLRH